MDVFYWPVLVLVVGQLNGEAFAEHSSVFLIIAAFFAHGPVGGNKVLDGEETQHPACPTVTYRNQPALSLQGVRPGLQSLRRFPTPRIGKARKST